MNEDDNRHKRYHDKIQINLVDDTDGKTLTVSDIKELKWVANASRFTKWIIAIVFALSSMTWLPNIVEAISSIKHK
jgi:hypothetical protein